MRSYQYSVVNYKYNLLHVSGWFTSIYMLDNLVVLGQVVHIHVITCKDQI